MGSDCPCNRFAGGQLFFGAVLGLIIAFSAVRQEMDGEDIPEVTCCDCEEWEIEIRTIEDCVLWDADYLDGHLYLDRPPEESKLLREAARIPDEYYAAIPDDLTDEQIDKQLRPLRKLCMSIIEAS